MSSPLLVRHEYHLIVDDGLSQGDVVHKRHKVNRHRGVVDLNVGVGTDDSGEVHAVNIDKAIDLAALVAHADTFVVNLEVGHRDNPVGEVHGEIAVDIDSGSCPVKISGVNAAVLQLVFHLANLHKEVAPFLAVKREKAALPVFLRDDEIGLNVSIAAACEIAEVAFAQKLMVAVGLILELPFDKDILLVDGIAFSKGLGKGGQQIGELIIVVNVGRVFLDGVLHSQDGRVFSCLGIEHANTIHVLHREVDVLKYLLALTTCSESLDRDEHTQEDCCKSYEYVPNHCYSSVSSSGSVYSSRMSSSSEMRS